MSGSGLTGSVFLYVGSVATHRFLWKLQRKCSIHQTKPLGRASVILVHFLLGKQWETRPRAQLFALCSVVGKAKLCLRQNLHWNTWKQTSGLSALGPFESNGFFKLKPNVIAPWCPTNNLGAASTNLRVSNISFDYSVFGKFSKTEMAKLL